MLAIASVLLVVVGTISANVKFFFSCSGEEGRISSSEVGHGSKDPKTRGVSEAELHVLENQKLQMLHLLVRG